MLVSVRNRIQEVEELLSNSILSGKESDQEILAHWTRYMCLVVATNLDICIAQIMIEYSRRQSDERVSRYASQELGRMSNMRPERIKNLLKNFDPDWAARLDERFDHQFRSSIGSIVANRNKIAHGRDSSFTLDEVQEWFEHSRILIVLIDELVLSSSVKPSA